MDYCRPTFPKNTLSRVRGKRAGGIERRVKIEIHCLLYDWKNIYRTTGGSTVVYSYNKLYIIHLYMHTHVYTKHASIIWKANKNIMQKRYYSFEMEILLCSVYQLYVHSSCTVSTQQCFTLSVSLCNNQCIIGDYLRYQYVLSSVIFVL